MNNIELVKRHEGVASIYESWNRKESVCHMNSCTARECAEIIGGDAYIENV